MSNLSTEYLAAIAAHDAAQHAYNAVVTAYRAGEVSDQVYLAARLVYGDAGRAFDVAFAAEQARAQG